MVEGFWSASDGKGSGIVKHGRAAPRYEREEPPEPFATPRRELARPTLAIAASLVLLFPLRFCRGGQRREDGQDFLDRASPASEQAQDRRAPERQA